MNQLYQTLGISKQATHQSARRVMAQNSREAYLLPIVKAWRAENGGVSVRQLYKELQPAQMGRDRFEQFCFAHGFRVQPAKNVFKTTQSGSTLPFPNRLADMKLTGVNQVWVSDITYYPLPNRPAYITVIMDLMSRFIVGYHVSQSLRTENTTLPALRQALYLRNPPQGVILHSDGGGQYYSGMLLELCERNGLVNSMARSVYENAHIERVHHTVKNQYIVYDHPRTLEELNKSLDRVIYLYNYQRKHQSLNDLTPADYELLNPILEKTMTHKTYQTKNHALVMN